MYRMKFKWAVTTQVNPPKTSWRAGFLLQFIVIDGAVKAMMLLHFCPDDPTVEDTVVMVDYSELVKVNEPA